MIGARWFPYVVIGAASIALTVFGWGYMKGYDKAEVKYQKSMARALKVQHAQMIAQSQLEKELALDALEKKYAIRKKITKVPKPTVSCDLPAPCLHWYDNILRAAASNGPGTD